MYRPLLRAYRIQPLLKSSASPLIVPRVCMSLRRPHSTKESPDKKPPLTNGNGHGLSSHNRLPENGHKEIDHDMHDNEHSHTHSHSIFGHSHSHGDAHTHDAEQIIAALKGTGEPWSSTLLQNFAHAAWRGPGEPNHTRWISFKCYPYCYEGCSWVVYAFSVIACRRRSFYEWLVWTFWQH